MKPHRILKSFKGNQTGNGETEHFEKDTVAHLSRSLAETAVKAGFAEPHVDQPEGKAKDRDTKVVEPDEFKEESQDEAQEGTASAKRKKRA